MTAEPPVPAPGAEPGRWRKRPVEIEAVQLIDDPALSDPGWEDIAEWCGGELRNYAIADSGEYETRLIIRTLEGDMTAGEGDWIIKGVKGEFYPCRDDIFAATYEPAGEPLVLPADEFAAVKSVLEHWARAEAAEARLAEIERTCQNPDGSQVTDRDYVRSAEILDIILDAGKEGGGYDRDFTGPAL